MQAPCCKPLRIIELSVMVICFSLLFFLRKYNVSYDIVLPKSVLIHLFSTYGPLMIVLAVDILCELLKTPITNVPMILVLVLGAVLCSSAGIVLLVTRIMKDSCHAFRTLNVIGLLSAVSWFSSLIFVIDAIIVIRFA